MVTTKPTIHLNGSSAEMLFEGFATAAGDLRRAIQSMRAAAPHGRDYYVQGPDAYTAARAEHEGRLAALNVILKEVEALAESVTEQNDARRAQQERR